MNEEIVRPQTMQNIAKLSPAFAALARRSFRSRLVAWFNKNGRELPWRRTRDPYAVLVSEMMLQQTQVATVIDYFQRWMKRFPDFASLSSASEADVLHAWQGLGYYSRARNLHRAAQIVVEKHGGKMPRDIEAIRALPGIGRYTAGAVATFAFDQSTPILDANIARVLARLFDIHTPVDTAAGQLALWRIAGGLQPRKSAGVFNESLMELGALVCTPRQPKCPACPVRSFCSADKPAALPIKKPRRNNRPSNGGLRIHHARRKNPARTGNRQSLARTLEAPRNPKSKIQNPKSPPSPPRLSIHAPSHHALSVRAASSQADRRAAAVVRLRGGRRHAVATPAGVASPVDGVAGELIAQTCHGRDWLFVRRYCATPPIPVQRWATRTSSFGSEVRAPTGSFTRP